MTASIARQTVYNLCCLQGEGEGIVRWEYLLAEWGYNSLVNDKPTFETAPWSVNKPVVKLAMFLPWTYCS